MVDATSTSTPLSPLDYIFTGQDMIGIDLSFEFTNELDLERIQKSLNQTLKIFAPLHCQIIRQDSQLVRIPLPKSIQIQEKRFEDVRVQFALGNKLLAVTLSADGKTLGISMSHAIGDGLSLVQFLLAWSFFDHHPDQPLPSPLQPDWQSLLIDSDLTGETQTLQQAAKTVYYPIDFEQKLHPLPKHKTQKLEISIHPKQLKKISDAHNFSGTPYELICALLWKSCGPIWNADQEPQFFHQAIDLRRRIERVPKNFFGNAFWSAFTSLSQDELKSSTLSHVSQAIQTSLKKVTEDQLHRYLTSMRQLQNHFGSSFGDHIDPSFGQKYFFVTDFSRMPVSQFKLNNSAPQKWQSWSDFPGVLVSFSDNRNVLQLHIQPPAHFHSQTENAVRKAFGI